MEKRFKELSKKEWAKGLSAEDVDYITKQIVRKEVALRGEFITNQMFGSEEDISQNIQMQLYAKDANGKRGIKAMKEDMSVAHFTNTLYYIARNEFNGNLRKKSYQDLVFNTVSLETELGETNEGTKMLLKDTLSDEMVSGNNEIDKCEEDLHLIELLKTISNEETNKYIIRYKDEPVSKFSFRKFAKLFFEISTGAQVRAADFDEIIYEYDNEEKNYIPASRDSINKLMKTFKNNLRNNKNFNELLRGGIAC